MSEPDQQQTAESREPRDIPSALHSQSLRSSPAHPETDVPGSPLKAYLQLLRLPAVFTAMADIFLGFLLTRASLADGTATLGLLLVTSSALYLAGMVFNDVFDVAQDARERPTRPIPSGRVSRDSAIVLGTSLVAVGLIAATALRWLDPSCGWNPLLVAGLIIGAVLLYDGVLKSTPLGPVMMGTCRFLNVLLGASAGGAALGSPFSLPQLWVAAGLGVYIVGVTWFARREAVASRTAPLLGGLAVVNLGLAVLLGWILQTAVAAPKPLALLLLAVIALSVNKRALLAVSSPSPQTVQFAVRTMLLSIITLDAALIYAHTGNIVLASLIAVALILPAAFLGRLTRIT